MQVVGAYYLNNLRSYGLVAIMDQLFNEIEVDKDDLFFFAQLDGVKDVELNQTFDRLQQHPEVWICVGAADGRAVDVDLKR